jgi:hypothetical protein
VRPRDPRRLARRPDLHAPRLDRGRLAEWPQRPFTRRTEELARVRIVDPPEGEPRRDGSVVSRQAAELRLPREELDRIWTPEYLERLARTYWRFLGKISFGLLRVLYAPDSREIALVRRPFVLLSFRAPEYDVAPRSGMVTWRIDTGLLVSPRGRGRGFLRIHVERLRDEGDDTVVRVECSVSNFYPMLAAARPGGRRDPFGRLALAFYSLTQLRIHVVVTHAFLRSLARLDLAPSVVGALRAGEAEPARTS